MENICSFCYKNPRAHSFTLLSDYNNKDNNGKLFYTKIADAELYNSTNSIIKHYENYLNFIKPENWIWIVDFDNIQLKHILEVNTTIELSKLIKKYNVSKVIIINENIFFHYLFKISKPFIKDIKIEIYSKSQKKIFLNYLNSINIDNNIIQQLFI
jgi:hypothetical protein